jgi:perosamine synthetase
MTVRSRNPLRHQLPAHSPVPLRGVAEAFVALVGRRPDPAETLADHLRSHHGAREALLLGSGTQALALALEGAAEAPGMTAGPSPRTGDGPPVALPAYSCFDVASAAVAAGRPVRFYDMDPRTLGPDPDSLRRTLHEGARVVVIAPLFGIPVDWELIEPILEEGGAVVVEDAAQGHGARWRGEPLGSRGPWSVLSFGRGKGWTGGGGGGALLLRDEDVPAPLRSRLPPPAGAAASLRTLAVSGVIWALSRPGIYRVPRSLPLLGLGETHYRAPVPAVAISRSSAAFLLASRARAEGEAAIRRRNAEGYRVEMRAGTPAEGFEPPPGSEAGFLRFPVRLAGGMEGFRDPRRARFLGAAPGYPRVLPRLEALAGLLAPGETRKDWPGAAELVERLVTLPTHSRTRAEERRELVGLFSASGRAGPPAGSLLRGSGSGRAPPGPNPGGPPGLPAIPP